MISLEEAKCYLRVDSSAEDEVVNALLSSAEALCADVARLSDEQLAAINGAEDQTVYEEADLEHAKSVFRVAVLYTLAYFWEHREEADHHELTLTLRSILFSLREGIL